MNGLPEDSFVIVIQTFLQRQMYSAFSRKVLCIDSMHQTNTYGFKLVSVMVADNYGRGEQVNASIDGIGLLEGLITKFSSFDSSIRSTGWLVLMQPRNRAGYQDQRPGAAVKVVMTDDGTLHTKLNLTCTYMQQLQCISHADNIYTW